MSFTQINSIEASARPRDLSWLNLANKITMSRGILVIIIFIARFFWHWANIYTFLGVAAAAMTDAVDGKVARARNEITRLGAGLDRGVDKLLFFSVFYFIWENVIHATLTNPQSLTILVIILLTPLTFIEITLLSLGAAGSYMKWPIESSRSGKRKMVLECICASWWALINDIGPFGTTLESKVFLWPMVILLLVSNILALMSASRYITAYWPLLCSYLKENGRIYHP